jgi:outer membrane protein OmpA-like peptidoglycan-associated protein
MLKFISVGIAALVLAAPASAQQRGTIEVGGFASRTSFGNGLNMDAGNGFGGRTGAFIAPSLSIEFEGGAANSSRSLGLNDVHSSILSTRLTVVPIKVGRFSLLAGAGIDHTDTYFIESYGPSGLLGGKFALNDRFAVRVDGIVSHMSHGDYTNKSLHIGLSMYRHPRGVVTTVTRTIAGEIIPQRPDSVSAAETRRLRMVAVRYDDLRDSLNLPIIKVPADVSSAKALATMKEMIHFTRDEAELSDSAKAILAAKVPIFKANPAMRIMITGYASSPGTEEYNFALGRKRAEAARGYLVSLGVEAVRIEVSTRGEGMLLVEGPGELANAENRRSQFRLLIADPFLVAPKKP